MIQGEFCAKGAILENGILLVNHIEGIPKLTRMVLLSPSSDDNRTRFIDKIIVVETVAVGEC